MDTRSLGIADSSSAPIADEQRYWDEGIPLLRKLLYDSRSSADVIALAVHTVNRRRPREAREPTRRMRPMPVLLR